MANWCVNIVSFAGDPANVLKAVQLLKTISYDPDTNRKPQLPDFLQPEHVNMMEFDVGPKNVFFRTAWVPDIEAVRLIAEHFQLDYTHLYEESGMKIYGEAASRSGVFSNISVSRSETAGITFNAGKHEFTFQGRKYKDDWGIMVELLNAKRVQRDAAYRDRNPFRSTGNITGEELHTLYGELAPAELLLKLAEHKNFDAARKIFETWDEQSVIEMDNLRMQDYRNPSVFTSADQYLADRFLGSLIEKWDSKQKQEQNRETQLSQLELVAWRLAGRLPHIDINGTDFTIDLRLSELRDTESPWNRIDISEMEPALDGDGYLFFYDNRKRNVHELDGNLTELPENVVLVELPNEYILDPVAAARNVGYNDDQFLTEFPIRENLKADVIPLEATFLPQMIAENLEKRNNEIRQIKPGR